MEKSNYAGIAHIDTVWTPERSLWCAVVGQTIIDAASTEADVRQEVIDWLESEDLATVCGMAGLRPEAIATAINGILYDPDRKAAFRRAMTFKLILKNWVESHYGTIDTKGE